MASDVEGRGGRRVMNVGGLNNAGTLAFGAEGLKWDGGVLHFEHGFDDENVADDDDDSRQTVNQHEN